MEEGQSSAATEAALTIDEFSRESELPASTVRLYQYKGLLPPPERRGRTGYYGQQHRDRLNLITHLQDRGFSLAAIKEVFDAWGSGRTLDYLLGVGDVVPTFAREPLRFTVAELLERFEGVGLTQAQIQKTVELGLVEFDGTEVVVRDPAFVDIGPAIAKLGVPMDEILDQYEAVQEAVAGIVERFQEGFERNIWEPFEAEGLPSDRILELSSAVARLTNLSTAAVTIELRQQLQALSSSYIERATKTLLGDDS